MYYQLIPFLFTFIFKGEAHLLSNIETLQFVNNRHKQEEPINVFIFFICTSEFAKKFAKYSQEEFLDMAINIKFFMHENRFFFLIKPITLHLTQREISRKILLHHDGSQLMGISVVAINCSGTKVTSLHIPAHIPTIKGNNLLFLIGDEDINLEYGLLSLKEKITIKIEK